LFAAQPKQNAHDLDGTCGFAKIELFHDIAFRRVLNTQPWARLQVLEPNLLPWNIGQNMLDVNAHIIITDRFLFNHRFGHFWANHYANDGEADEGKGKGKGKGEAESDEDAGSVTFPGNLQKVLALCRKHNRMEYGDMLHQLRMQLGCGLLTYQEWAYVNSKIADAISGDGVEVTAHSFQGSHTYHNSSGHGVHCRSPFCMIWESTVDNGLRKVCHKNFLETSSNIDHCTCSPGRSIPCVVCARETPESIRRTFLDRFNRSQPTRNATDGKPMNRFGRCPFPHCRREEAIISKLSDYFDSTIQPLVKHMNISHGMDMKLS
jgi:hypothetical protein